MQNPEGGSTWSRLNPRVWLNNLPYVTMLVLGVVVLYQSFPAGPWQWMAPVAYVVYGVLGVLWMMYFLCPYCGSFGSPLCPSGHGVLAAAFRTRRHDKSFPGQFKKHIPVIIPLWFIPLIVGIVHLIGDFTWGYLVWVVVYSVNSFVLLPVIAGKSACNHCGQRSNCPWMKRGKRP